jgi:hypothetical protein
MRQIEDDPHPDPPSFRGREKKAPVSPKRPFGK